MKTLSGPTICAPFDRCSTNRWMRERASWNCAARAGQGAILGRGPPITVRLLASSSNSGASLSVGETRTACSKVATASSKR